MDEAAVYTVPEAARLLRISNRSYYAGFAGGELPGVRIGRAIRVSGSQLARLLEVEEVIDDTTGGADDEGSRPRLAIREP